MTFTAVATRSDGWWAIEIDEHPGIFSQATHLEEVPTQAADAIGFTLGINIGVEDIAVEQR